MNTHAEKTQGNKSQAVANNLSKQASVDESIFIHMDNRPKAIAQRRMQEAINNSPRVHQMKSCEAMAGNFIQRKNNPEELLQGKLEPVQRKENNTGLPDNLKSGIENMSGYSMNDVKVHYNSDKPAQLQAHAYAQGTDIHIAPGQEKHLPHEAWHVVQQKQGRVKTTMQMKGSVNINDDASLEKEANLMGAIALSRVKDKTNKTLETLPSLKSVFQRQIIVNSAEIDKDAILDAAVISTRGRIHGWLTEKGMTATLKRNSKISKAEINATTSAKKGREYLDENLPNHITSLLAKYDTENRTFGDYGHLESQLIQDVKLSILGLGDIVGIDHHGGQFSGTDKSGGGKPLRIYRTTTRTDWNTYLQSKEIGGLLHGHGGALGQALDYFYKSKTSAKDGPLYDNVIFEIKFTTNASSAIDYNEISSGGEGGGPKGGKLTGKNEQNDIFGEKEIFSVNLAACRELILSMNPTIRRVDEMKGEDTQYSKRLLELAIKHGGYPPQNLTEAERTELEGLRGH